MKKLMLLGGLRSLLPVIEAAHRYGIHVITVDYLPQNVAHAYSDEYYNVSILDKEAVLSLAQRLGIDGIMSFGVDPGVVTAAYVAEQLGLPFQCSYAAACVLQDKSKFRAFLSEHGFRVPQSKGYTDVESALIDFSTYEGDVMVKPVDAAGSKGVSRVSDISLLRVAVDTALSSSHVGQFIMEDYLEQEGASSDSDCFSVRGELVCCSFSNQYFDARAENPYVPSGVSWPSTMPAWAQDELHEELQRLMRLLEVDTGIYNVETRLCKNGKPYIMEVSARGGGPRLAEMLRYASGVDLIDAMVRAAVGMAVDGIAAPEYEGCWYEMILHADGAGVFERLDISEEWRKKYLVEEDVWVKEGEKVSPFTGANRAIGVLVLRFSGEEEMKTAMRESAENVCLRIVAQ